MADQEASPQRIFFVDEPEELRYLTNTFGIAGHEAYLTIGVDDRWNVKEMALVVGRAGSLVTGLTEGISKMTTLALRHGVPLQAIIAELKGMRFEPQGEVTVTRGLGTKRLDISPRIPVAKSLLDYVARWLEMWDSSRNKPDEMLPNLEEGMQLEPQTDREDLESLRERGPGQLGIKEDQHLYG